MKTKDELLEHVEYLRELKPLLPQGAFRRNPRKLVAILLHVIITAACFIAIRLADSTWLHALFALVAGHSVACLGLYAHDLSHKTVLAAGPLLRVVETLVWTISAVPATVWRRVHNATHHHETNTVGDPDRWFLVEEKQAATNAYTQVFYPHKDGLKFNPLVCLHFIAYVVRNSVAALGTRKPTVVPNLPQYTTRQKVAVAFEIVLILGYQILVFFMIGSDWVKFVWASPVVYSITSGFVMTYIFTNHSLNPLCEHTDPVIGSTSVEVPGVCDLLHSNFSYHTEHHLFPGMDSSHYPEVSEILRSKFPDRYNRMPVAEAWKRLWNTEGFLQ